PKMEGFSIRPSYSPLKMYVNDTDPDESDDYGVLIEGFWEGALGMKVDETKVVRIPSEKGYGDGLTRIFEITIVSIDN
ncbi:MAG: FKBP-type peptidyl-prolyl cis-trans isomerase, partial [Thermoplasmata archaeon]